MCTLYTVHTTLYTVHLLKEYLEINLRQKAREDVLLRNYYDAFLQKYITFFSSDKRNNNDKISRKNLDGVRGLVNSGNSCFVNAVLQALSSCPSVYYWIQVRE